MAKKSEYFNVDNLKALMAEFLGTAILTFVGVASCLNWTHEVDTAKLTRIGLTFGLILASIIYGFGPISGGHFNPAVTVGMIIATRINGALGAGYIVFQYLGALCGAGLLYVLQAEKYDGVRAPQFGLTKINPDMTMEQGLFTELLVTFIFVMTILLITDKRCSDFSHGSVAVGIGFSLCALEFGFVPATGGSLNPARSFGPALVVLHFEQLWVYMVGPTFGGVLGSIVYRLFTYETPPKDESNDDANPPSGAGDINNDSNAVFVSSDANPSYDEITIDDEVKKK